MTSRLFDMPVSPSVAEDEPEPWDGYEGQPTEPDDWPDWLPDPDTPTPFDRPGENA